MKLIKMREEIQQLNNRYKMNMINHTNKVKWNNRHKVVWCLHMAIQNNSVIYIDFRDLKLGWLNAY